MVKILFLTPYPLDLAPSQRFRFEQYFRYLDAQRFSYQVQSFLGESDYATIYGQRKIFRNARMLLVGLLKRIWILRRIPSFDFVFIHRETMPLGPPIFEWLIAKVFQKKIIYDFDDAIWLTDRKQESILLRTVRWRSKVSQICRWSYKVSCGNAYLADHARRFATNVVVNPTTIDTERIHRIKRGNKSLNELIIGWTGTHSTLKYLNEIEAVLSQLENKFPHVVVEVIANIPPTLNIPRIRFREWSKETEIEDLTRFDIGIMPLPDDEWTKGKCGFKALQYMSLEIPTVASPVGVNNQIIQSGVTGFLCGTAEEWVQAIESLIQNPAYARQIGKESYKAVVERYSVLSNVSTFLSLFE